MLAQPEEQSPDGQEKKHRVAPQSRHPTPSVTDIRAGKISPLMAVGVILTLALFPENLAPRYLHKTGQRKKKKHVHMDEKNKHRANTCISAPVPIGRSGHRVTVRAAGIPSHSTFIQPKQIPGKHPHMVRRTRTPLSYKQQQARLRKGSGTRPASPSSNVSCEPRSFPKYDTALSLSDGRGLPFPGEPLRTRPVAGDSEDLQEGQRRRVGSRPRELPCPGEQDFFPA